jgi:hypothetical protein
MSAYEPSEGYLRLQARLQERGVETYSCEVCGSVEWIGLGLGGPDTLALQSSEAVPEGESDAYPVYGFYCNNCGLVRLHHRSVFE